MKIVKLDINEEFLSDGVDAVALVELPAIEQDFFAFRDLQFESYTDYPESATNAAKRALEWVEEHGWGDCGTPVGKARAHQLANREPISEETIARMAAFARHLQYEDVPYSEGCGGLMVDAWGGRAGIEWASSKLEEIRQGFEIDTTALTPYVNETSGSAIVVMQEEGNIDVYGYETKNFEICPAAIGLFEHLKTMDLDEDTIGMVRSAAVNSDALFAKEKEVIANGIATHEDLVEAIALGADVEDIMHEVDERVGMEHDVTWIMGHIEVIKSYLPDPNKDELEDAIINNLAEIGIDEGSLAADGWVAMSEEEFNKFVFAIVSRPEESTIDSYGDYKVLYRYMGPQDNKNRNFCSRMLRANLLFRKEDINNMTVKAENKEFGIYDIFKWKGSFNCRHYWQGLIFKRENAKLGKALAIQDMTGEHAVPNKKVVSDLDPMTDTVSQKFAEALREKQMIVGPLMTPNKLILRMDENGDPYYVYFTADTIEKIARKFMKNKLGDSVNIEHDMNQKVDGVYLAETWLVEDEVHDKANLFGYSPKVGEWFGSYKVDNKAIWDEYVKTGRVKGFSVEGYFADKLIEQSKEAFVYPTPLESEDEFISRCMGDSKMNSEFPDQDQRAAVCYSYWQNR